MAGITLKEHLKKTEVKPQLTDVLSGLADISKEISNLFYERFDALDRVNASGDKQLSIDVKADKIYAQRLLELPINDYASEEQEGL